MIIESEIRVKDHTHVSCFVTSRYDVRSNFHSSDEFRMAVFNVGHKRRNSIDGVLTLVFVVIRFVAVVVVVLIIATAVVSLVSFSAEHKVDLVGFLPNRAQYKTGTRGQKMKNWELGWQRELFKSGNVILDPIRYGQWLSKRT